MKKLEYKYLCSYLPYEVPVQYHAPEDKEGKCDEIVILTADNIRWVLEGTYHKIILHPLSDIVRNIKHNKQTFVPALELWSIEVEEEKAFEVYGTIPIYWKVCMKQIPGLMDYGTMERLFKWHFDCFSLIENNSAIDITKSENHAKIY